MVTEDGDLSIGGVVRSDLLLDRSVLRRILELLLESPRGVISTEDLGGQALHLRVKVLVETGCLLVSVGKPVSL